MLEKLIQETHAKKENLFFDVHQKVTAQPRKPLTFEQRLKNWVNLFGSKNPETGKKETNNNFWIEKDQQSLILCFSSGLRVEDKDNTVAFGAEDKSTINLEAALPTIAMVANHLRRRGDVMEVGSIYSGPASYVETFEMASREATLMMFQEELQNKKLLK